MSTDQQLVLPEKIDERLATLRQWRMAYVETLDQKIATLQQEKHEMMAEYDAEIEQFRRERAELGGVVPPTPVGVAGPTEAAQRVFEFLRKHAGTWFTASEIRESVPFSGVLTVMLANWMDDGMVRRQGESRGTRYCVPAEYAATGVDVGYVKEAMAEQGVAA